MKAKTIDERDQDLLQKLMLHTRKRKELFSISERLKQITQELSTLNDESQKIEDDYLSKIYVSPPTEATINLENRKYGNPKPITRKKSILRDTLEFIAKR